MIYQVEITYGKVLEFTDPKEAMAYAQQTMEHCRAFEQLYIKVIRDTDNAVE